MTRHPVIAVALALLATVLTGCASSTTPATVPTETPTATPVPDQSLGPRPAELRLDNVDLCALLTPAQTRPLKTLTPPTPGVNGDGEGSRDCQWSTAFAPREGWLVRAILVHGAGYFRDSVTGVRQVQIGGFPALQSASPIQDPERHCIDVIDVAAGQTLWVQYVSDYKERPGMNHKMACQLADRQAEQMLANLRTLAR